MDLHDRILGCLVGCGLGDALGVPHDFRTSIPVSEYTGTLEFRLKRFNRFKKETKYTAVGQVSDDTEMMLILSRLLIENRGYDRKSALAAYMEWANHPTTALMGRNTREIFKGVTTVRGVEARINRLKRRKTTQSNGALMRCAILVLLEDRNDEDCTITNPDMTCVQTNQIYLRLVSGAFKGLPKSELRKLLDITTTEHMLGSDYKILVEIPSIISDTIEKALEGTPRDVTKVGKGWCIHGLYCAIYALFHFDNYRDAIDWTIRLGGDTDTNAAIAGALMGAHYGYQALEACESENIETLLNCDTSLDDYERPEKWTMSVVKEYAGKLTDIFG